VGSIIGDSYTKNERLYQVGFTQILPKEVQYDRVDNLSEKAGYFVFASPNSSRVFYIPAVVYNYFDKFYGTKEVRSSMIPNSDLFTLFFMDDDDVKGFIMIDKKNAPSGAPARLLPTNPDAYLQTIVGENALAFSEKVDIESKEALEFMGEIKTRPESEEPSLRDIFEEQIALFEQALEFMDEGEDDDEIAALRDAIEGARLMIDDDTEEQAEEEIIESIDAIPDENDELGQVSVANDQEILPTPSADDLEVEEVIAEEKEDVLEADDDELDLDLNDLEISQVRLSEEDIKDKLDEMGVDYNEIMEEGVSNDLNDIQQEYLGYDYDADTNTWSMGFAKGGKTMNDKVSDKIRLLRKEGKPQDQAVAIALSMLDKGELAHGGTTHVSYEIVKSEDIGLDAKEFKYHVLSSQGNTLGCQTMKECREVISLAKQGSIELGKGGKTMTPSDIVALLTDREVAQKLAEKMMQSLESLEYGEMTEQDMAREAMQDIMHSRKMLTEILTYEA
jgi:hypothetical protein